MKPSRGDLFGDRCLDASGSRGQGVLAVAALVTPGRGTGQAVVVDSSRDRLASVRLPPVDPALHEECTEHSRLSRNEGGEGLRLCARTLVRQLRARTIRPLKLGRALSYSRISSWMLLSFEPFSR